MTDRKWLIPLLSMAGGALTALAVEVPIAHRHTTRPGCEVGIPDGNYQYRARSPSQFVVSKTGVLLRRATRVGEVLEQTTRAHTRGEYSDDLIRRRINNETHVERVVTEVQQEPLLAEKRMQRLPAPGTSDFGATETDVESEVTRRTFRNTFTVVEPPREPNRQTVIDLYQLDRPGLKIDQCEISQVALQLHDDGTWVLSLRADQNRRPEANEPIIYNPQLFIKRNEFVVRLRCMGAFQSPPTEVAPGTGKPVLIDLHPCSFWVENGEPRYVRNVGHCRSVANYFHDIDRVEIEFFYR